MNEEDVLSPILPYTDEMNKVTFKLFFLVIYHTSHVTLELFYSYHFLSNLYFLHLPSKLYTKSSMALDTKNSDISYGMLYAY